MTDVSRRGRRTAARLTRLAPILLTLLPACDTVRVNPGFADRCWDVVRDAIPEGGVKLTSKTATGELRVVTARVEAVRSKASGGPRAISAECRFEDQVLTDFRLAP
jgi:hypothetical protein